MIKHHSFVSRYNYGFTTYTPDSKRHGPNVRNIDDRLSVYWYYEKDVRAGIEISYSKREDANLLVYAQFKDGKAHGYVTTYCGLASGPFVILNVGAYVAYYIAGKAVIIVKWGEHLDLPTAFEMVESVAEKYMKSN